MNAGKSHLIKVAFSFYKQQVRKMCLCVQLTTALNIRYSRISG
ncbi:hypothetical protein HMPREF1548_02599 [Clostridium sp. KLE 1755]|nr:hypothetical protein HMPREF1548_02599 [Clostridium sp. KLE 1755]